MAGTAVVAMRCGDDRWPADAPTVADSARSLMDAGWNIVLVAPPALPNSPGVDGASPLTLAVGQSRSGRRAVPVVTHILVDPADPALGHPPLEPHPEPLAILEAESIAALVGSGFPVVVSGQVPVVPYGEDYRPVAAALDEAASAQRLAGDLGASALVFVAADGPTVGEIDLIEAERRLAGDPRCAAELRAAVRFLRAGGELAVITTPAHLSSALEGPSGGAGVLRIHRRLARPRSEAPVLAAGWC